MTLLPPTNPPPAADIAELRLRSVTDLVTGTMVYVRDTAVVYVYDRLSTATESLPEVVTPGGSGTGRWLAVGYGVAVSGASPRRAFTSVSADYTAVASDDVIKVTGQHTVTLYATPEDGQSCTVYSVSGGAFVVPGAGSSFVDVDDPCELPAVFESITLTYDAADNVWRNL